MAITEQTSAIAEILERHPAHRGSLIPILQDIQDTFGYLSPEALDELEARINISANEIYGVATFYTQFRFRPPGEHKIQVCQGTACHVRSGQQVLAEFEQRLGIEAGEGTEDGKFDLERVACLGCCALAPVVAVDGEIHAGVTPKQVAGLIAACRVKKDKA